MYFFGRFLKCGENKIFLKRRVQKRQAEQAEDEMNKYASKYKMMQHAVSEAEERAEYAENRLSSMRSQRKGL